MIIPSVNLEILFSLRLFFPLKISNISTNMQLDEHVSSNAHTRDILNDDIEPRRSKRQTTATSFRPDFLTSFVIEISDIAYIFCMDEDTKNP